MNLTASDAWFSVGVAEGADVGQVSARIDALADLGGHEVVAWEGASRVALVELNQAADGPGRLVAAMRQLSLAPEVAWALAGTHTPDGRPLGLTPEVLLHVHGELPSAVKAALHARGAAVVEDGAGPRGLVRVAVASPTRAKVLALSHALRGARGLADAHPNFMRLIDHRKLLNDPYLDQQWYVFTAQGPAAWDITTGSADVTVAVIDDGFDMNHEDLTVGDKVAPGQWDFADGDGNPTGGSWDNHGTAVAGVAVAIGNNGKGVAGLCPHCRFLPIRQGYSDYSTAQMFGHVRDSQVAAVNNSWGYGYPSSTVVNAIQDCIANGRAGLGTMVLFASGNEGQNIDQVQDISAIPGVVAVGSSTQYDQYSGYSNWGASMGVCAPADGQVTTDKTSGGYSNGAYTGSFGGTSGACPVAAGVAGLIFSANPGLDEMTARQILLSTAAKVAGDYDSNGKSMSCGYGRIDAGLAVATAAGVDPADLPDPPEPTPTPDPGSSSACAGVCGGQSAQGCWCDGECMQYGDCCEDACDTCGAGCEGGQPQPEPEPEPTPDPGDGGPDDLGTGDGHCLDFVECVQTCQSEGCVNACAATVDTQGLQLAMDFFGCLDQAGCYYAETQEQFDGCLVGYCGAQAQACFDDAEGGVVTPEPGAGGGSDDPTDPPSDGPPGDDPPGDDPSDQPVDGGSDAPPTTDPGGDDPPADDPPADDPPADEPPADAPPSDDTPGGDSTTGDGGAPAQVPGEDGTHDGTTPPADEPAAEPGGTGGAGTAPGDVTGSAFTPAADPSSPEEIVSEGGQPSDGCGVTPHGTSGVPGSAWVVLIAVLAVAMRRRRHARER